MGMINGFFPKQDAPPYGNDLKKLFDGDDERAQAFVDLLASFASGEEAEELLASAVLAGSPAEAIRRLQDDSRPLMRQDAYDQVFPGLVPAEEATTDAITTPVIWTVS